MYATLTPAEELAIDNITQSVMDELLVTDMKMPTIRGIRGAAHCVHKRGAEMAGAVGKMSQAARNTFVKTEEEKIASARRAGDRAQYEDEHRQWEERGRAMDKKHKDERTTSDPGGIMQESHHHKQMQQQSGMYEAHISDLTHKHARAMQHAHATQQPPHATAPQGHHASLASMTPHGHGSKAHAVSMPAGGHGPKAHAVSMPRGFTPHGHHVHV
jgi:hypothetical protein